MVIGQKNLAGRNQSTRQSRQPPAQGVAKPTSTHVWRGPSPQNTSWGRLPTYLKFRATNLISFQTGNLWLTGRYLFLGMASASSKWKHNRLWPPATWTAQLLTWVRKLWPAQLRHKLQLFSIVITCFNLWVPHQVILNYRRNAMVLHCFSSPCLLKHKLEAFLKPHSHRVFQHELSDTLWVSYIWGATAGLEISQRLFPSVFFAQCDLKTRSHLICFLLGFKETVFHFAGLKLGKHHKVSVQPQFRQQCK